MRKTGYWTLVIVVLGAVLAAAAIVSLAVGAVSIPLWSLPSVLAGADSVERNILLRIRLPRIVLGFAVGGSLSVAGVILQGMFRNPLVEPYTLGISGGAALAVCIGIVFGFSRVLGTYALPVAGFAGALLVVILLYTLSMRRRAVRIQHLLLTGVMISFVVSSLIMLFMAVAKTDDLQGIVFWTMGSLDRSDTVLMIIAFVTSIAGLGGALVFSRDLNALMVGEEDAMHLGVNIEFVKRALFIIASVLTGVAVAVGGVIGFVGLLVPHIMRRITGSDHRVLIIASFLAGAAFLILSDTVARMIIAPLELPVGVITGIAGGILFIILLSRKRAA
ncbi:MAG: iron ABC transporter permease [Spirochaetes bacterium]|nr:iron ABC transporter permease [Spirochaetota bacterium]